MIAIASTVPGRDPWLRGERQHQHRPSRRPRTTAAAAGRAAGCRAAAGRSGSSTARSSGQMSTRHREHDAERHQRDERACRAGPAPAAAATSADRAGARSRRCERLMVVDPRRWACAHCRARERNLRLAVGAPEEVASLQLRGADGATAHVAGHRRCAGRRRPLPRGRRARGGRPIASGGVLGAHGVDPARSARPRPSARPGRPTSRATGRPAGCCRAAAGRCRCRKSTSAR